MTDEEPLVDESNTQLTMITGTVIERDYVYIAQYFDKYEKVADEIEYTRLSQVDLADKVNPWGAHDRPWQIVSLCVWQSYPNARRLYIALSAEGEVELMGPGGNPMIAEHIDGAGLNKPWSKFLGYVSAIREIGGSLYVCGGANQVYRRSADGGWTSISDSILIDPHERQKLDSPMSGIRHFSDILGLAEDDIYATGLEGEVYHFDGARWKKLATDTTKHLNAICIVAVDDIFIAGAYGTLLRGNKHVGFRSVWPLEDEASFTGMAFFEGLIYLASTSRGLYTFNPKVGEAKSYQTNLDPDFVDPHHLEAHDGVLWSFGYKDLAYFDGVTWTRVHHPDNPKIGS